MSNLCKQFQFRINFFMVTFNTRARGSCTSDTSYSFPVTTESHRSGVKTTVCLTCSLSVGRVVEGDKCPDDVQTARSNSKETNTDTKHNTYRRHLIFPLKMPTRITCWTRNNTCCCCGWHSKYAFLSSARKTHIFVIDFAEHNESIQLPRARLTE